MLCRSVFEPGTAALAPDFVAGIMAPAVLVPVVLVVLVGIVLVAVVLVGIVAVAALLAGEVTNGALDLLLGEVSLPGVCWAKALIGRITKVVATNRLKMRVMVVFLCTGG
jgi:hypothetical protein